MAGVSTVFRPTRELDAAIGLLNTYDELENPPDRLVSIDVVRRVLARHGLDDLADGLTTRQLERVRGLREDLRSVFLADGDAERADVLNRLFAEAGARPELRADGDGWSWSAGATEPGIGRLTATLAGALASVLAAGAADRLGICAGDPCHCVFLDTTRSRRQRYCCELCNDRMAAAAYRRRKTTG